MREDYPLPNLWLLSDARNERVLDRLLRSFRQRVGFVYRHYHLPPDKRVAEFDRLAKIARAEGHLVILSDSALTAREWGAEGVYGAPLALYPRRQGLLYIATAHDLREIGQANRHAADAVMVSPVFPTRSHPDAATIGPVRFRKLASQAQMPVIALGGLNAKRASQLGCERWGAIDGLSTLAQPTPH